MLSDGDKEGREGLGMVMICGSGRGGCVGAGAGSGMCSQHKLKKKKKNSTKKPAMFSNTQGMSYKRQNVQQKEDIWTKHS